MSSLTPESPSTESRASRTYGDIVLAAFRRNRLAVAAVGVVAALFLVAIFTPLISNDRPIAFYGVMPSWYDKTYRQISLGGLGDVRRAPQRFRAELAAWQGGTVTRNDIFMRMRPEEYRRLESAFERVEKAAKMDRNLGSRWEAKTITWNEIAALMDEGDRTLLEPVRQRVLEDLARVYADEIRSRTAVGIGLNLRRLELQLGAEYREKARELTARVAGLATEEYVVVEGEGRAEFDRRLQTLGTDLEAAFATRRVELKPRWYYPVPDSLQGQDVFLMSAALALLILFIPVRMIVRRRRKGPWRGIWRWAGLLLLACAAAGILWHARHRPLFETIRFKREVAENGVRMDRAIWPPHRYRGDEVRETREDRLLSPRAKYPLGTDDMARDVLSQLLWGSRISLAVGFVSAGIASVIGIFLGALAGYFRGATDIAISRVVEWFLCIPVLFAVLAAAAVLPPRIFYTMLVIGIFGWMGIARLMRGEFLRLASQDFVTAARAAGAGHLRIIFRHVLPNGLAPVLVASAFGVAGGILIEGSLSFLGFGVRPPDVSWGSILGYSREKPEYLWLILPPGILIWLTVTAYNLVGDGLRDAIDPRLKV